MQKEYLKLLNFILAFIILIVNISIYIPQLFDIIKSGGGPMGFGYLFFFPLIFLILFTIPSVITLIRIKKISQSLFTINIIGFIVHLFTFICFYDLIFYKH